MIAPILDDLNGLFVENAGWYHPFFDNIDDPNTLKESELKSFLSDKLNKVSDDLCKSIIVGEYVYSDVQVTLIEIMSCCNRIYENILFFENIQLHTFTEKFVKIIKDINSAYLKFSKQIVIHISNPNTEIVFTTSKDFSEDSIFSSTFDDEVIQRCLNVFQLIGLANYDHFFDESISYFKSLLNFENRLNATKTPSKYFGIMHDKIVFLKYKWSVRQITTAKYLKTTNHQKGYIIDDELIFIHQQPQFINDISKLKEWKEYLDCHYEFIDNSNFYNSKINHIVINDDSLSLFDTHLLIKYFKDVKPNYQNLKETVEKFASRETEFTDNKYLFFKDLNYALNNQFSMLIEQSDINDDEVKQLKNKIDSLQNRIGYDNFFVDFKFLKYCIKKLNEFILNREALEVKAEILSKINEIRNLFISCERKIEWSESHHNLLYQLPYHESLVDYNADDIDKVYYASSFLLPLSVEQINKEFFDIKIEFQNKFNHFEILSSLDKEFGVIKEIRSKAEESDKKSIETLTIFTAIISFIVGTVSGFSFIDSFVKALIFILIFSISLLTFVLLIFISTKGIDKILNQKKVIISSYLGALGILLLLFTYKNMFDDKFELEKSRALKEIGNKKYIDSLNKIQDVKINKIENRFKVTNSNVPPTKKGN
ncbi:hypothetical protein [Chryseobacterium taiwanense]|uniref:Uncharacterized protein n=1 Tax=Chryseobacterium taiwanense TaxID=363331 RepID=A0A0B4E539_9FLAO|nr:hypothetical protein [Chryseobacterium taiwanense]KIC61723.1 hypothetical protein RM51_15095 [Chryseobacterium taiwanense]